MLNRRSFLEHSLALGAGLPLFGKLPFLAKRRIPPSDRIGIGIIGVGSLGRGHHLKQFLGMPQFEVVAVADPDRNHLDEAVAMTKGAAKPFADFRALLDMKTVDAVLIATPDHWHALTSVMACDASKDVYCEKPLSLTVQEGRRIVESARRTDRIFQVGTQQRSDSRFRQACELARSGVLGRILRVKVALGKGPIGKPKPDAPPPPHLDWDLWLGPAPKVPYNENRSHYTFRWFFNYSGGKLTDWGAHHLDIVQWGLGMENSGPIAVSGRGDFPSENAFETPVDFEVNYTYPHGIEVQVTGDGENGVTFTGTEAEVFVSRGEIRATPKDVLSVDKKRITSPLPVSTNHHQNWLESLWLRERPIADVEQGHRSATVCHLGNIAMRLGRKLQWDATKERFVGDEAADRLLWNPYRAPWSHP